MNKDKLIILDVDFEDPELPDRRFCCWHCVLREGLLSCYPEMAKRLDVERISWPRPWTELINMIGVDNQSGPVLILADDAPDGSETGRFSGARFVNDKDAMLHALSVRHGASDPHP